jgi:hypothetical protein
MSYMFFSFRTEFLWGRLSLAGVLSYPCYIPSGTFVIHAVCSSRSGFFFVAEGLEIIQCPLYHTIIAVQLIIPDLQPYHYLILSPRWPYARQEKWGVPELYMTVWSSGIHLQFLYMSCWNIEGFFLFFWPHTSLYTQAISCDSSQSSDQCYSVFPWVGGPRILVLFIAVNIRFLLLIFIEGMEMDCGISCCIVLPKQTCMVKQ